MNQWFAALGGQWLAARAEQIGWPQRRSMALLLAGLLLAFLAIGFWPWKEGGADFLGRRDPAWIGEDFTAFYAAGTLVASGLAPKLYDTGAIASVEHVAAGHAVGGSGSLPYFNPPFFALAFAPLSHLPLAQAYQVWTLVNLAFLAVNCWLLWLIAGRAPTGWRVLMIVGYIALFPVTYAIRIGQFSLILQASFAAGYLLMRRGSERLAGAAFSLLLIKPELLIPLVAVLVWKRRWRLLSTLAPIVTASIVASILLLGPGGLWSYPDYLLDSVTGNVAGVATNFMLDWSGLATLTFRGATAMFVRPVSLVLCIGTVAAVAWLWRGPQQDDSPSFEVRWAALTLGSLLIDPHLYLQDTVILVPAAVALAASLHPGRRAVGITAMVGGWVVLNGAGLIAAAALGGGLSDALGLPLHLPG